MRANVGSMTTTAAAPVRARIGASLRDFAVIAVGIGVLTAAGAVVRAVAPAPAQPNLVLTDLIAFGFTVLPTGLYLAVGEAGRHQAAWGKRRAGLQVVTAAGGRPGVGRIVLRTAVKLLPWQLAHIAVARLILDVDDPVTTWGSDALSLLLAALTIGMAWRDPQHRALHDRVAGTRVVPAAGLRPAPMR